MPIYEYHCPSCGNDFELFVRGKTAPACPDCHNKKIDRRMSVTARPAGSSAPMNLSNLGPPKAGGGGCGGGGCGCH